MKKLLICLLTVILFACNDRNITIKTDDNEAAISTEDKTPEPVYKQYQLDSIKVEGIINKICDSSYFRATYRKTKNTIEQEAEELTEAGATLASMYENAVPSVKKAKAILLKIQKEDFPILRKNYADLVKERMWEENVDVSGYGPKTIYIRLTGGVFADHKTIKRSYEAISYMLTLLRFTEIDFSWYEGATDYTNYKLTSKKDSDLN